MQMQKALLFRRFDKNWLKPERIYCRVPEVGKRGDRRYRKGDIEELIKIYDKQSKQKT